MNYFFLMMILSTLMIISSNNWFSSWMSLEINLMSFIPLIINNKKILTIESSLIYFLIQVIASIFFFYSIMIYYITFMNYLFLQIFNMNLMLISLMLKMGSAPFHFWLPIVMSGLNWMNNYIIMTWQKLGPLMLVNIINSKLIIFFIISSTLISAITGFNQSSLKKLMAYSSINQISWLLISLMKNNFLWKTYYLMYFFILINLILMFNLFNMNFLSQLFNMKKNMMQNNFILMNLLSLGGLPPFLGFFPKMFVIMNINNLTIIMILIMTSLIILYYYLRIIYSTIMLMNNMINKKNMLLINKLSYKMLMYFSMLTNFLLLMLIMMLYF